MFQIDNHALDAFGAPNPTGTPERNLLLAVLERAILDYVGNDQKERERAADWLFVSENDENDEDEDEDHKESYSYAWICEQLSLCPIGVKKFIKSLPKRGERKVAPWYFMRKQEQKLKKAS